MKRRRCYRMSLYPMVFGIQFLDPETVTVAGVVTLISVTVSSGEAGLTSRSFYPCPTHALGRRRDGRGRPAGGVK